MKLASNRTRATELNLKQFPVNPTVQLLKAIQYNTIQYLYRASFNSENCSGQQAKQSYNNDNVDDNVQANEVVIKRHRILTKTLDWYLSLAISQVDGLAQTSD